MRLRQLHALLACWRCGHVDNFAGFWVLSCCSDLHLLQLALANQMSHKIWRSLPLMLHVGS
jgi:hypothetical protein